MRKEKKNSQQKYISMLALTGHIYNALLDMFPISNF